VVLLGALLGLLAVHAVGVCLDFVAAIRYPFELDYGEGIVWQMAALVPGPRMYDSSPALPFIGIPYPPLYFLLVRAATGFMPDMLSAGRLISAASAVLIAPLVSGLVLVVTRHPGQRQPLRIAIAVAAGLLVLSLHAVRSWGLLMRVDTIGVALSLAGVLVAARADGGFRATTCALLLCVASVYCKQTQLPAGVAIFLVTLLRRPASALGAGAIAALVGLAALGTLQVITSGGFLLNIIGYNLNRMTWHNGYFAALPEMSSLPFLALMLVAAWVMLSRLFPAAPRPAVSGWSLVRLRLADQAAAARAIVLLYFIFSTLMLVTIFRFGSFFNYFLNCFCIGVVLIGVLLCDLAGNRRNFALAIGLLVVAVLPMPWRQLPERFPQGLLDQQSALVRRIAAADKPVASEDMTLLMRAGKPVIFDPAGVTELAAIGLWDEGLLLDMIRMRGFAFMITGGDAVGGSRRRSPAVDAAMRAAYPRAEQAGDLHLWLHLPP